MIIKTTTVRAETAMKTEPAMALTSNPTDVCVVDVANRAMKNVMADLRSGNREFGSHHGGIFTASVF